MCALTRRLTANFDASQRGRLFEQWLILECMRRIDYARSEARLYFWRTNHGAEVDLLVERHGKLVAAVECKTGRRLGGTDFNGLRSFASEHAKVPRFVVTPDAEPHRVEDILVTNWRDFLVEFESLI